MKLTFSIFCYITYLTVISYGAEKVNLGVYIESLCPDCRRFINNQLTPTFNELSDIFNIDFVPFGNANYSYNETTKEVTFECQHGPNECYGNIIQTCVVSKAGNNTQLSVDFIDCMFKSNNWTEPKVSASECAALMGLDWTALNNCAIGAYGALLEMEMGNKTFSLNPEKTYVPWITIDGQHTEQTQRIAETNLKTLVCDWYKGVKPKQCNETGINNTLK